MHKRKELIQGRYMGIKTNKKETTIYSKYFRFEPFSILQSIHNSQHFYQGQQGTKVLAT